VHVQIDFRSCIAPTYMTCRFLNVPKPNVYFEQRLMQ